MSVVLVINSGSSSFKYQLIAVDEGSREHEVLASGLVERIGEPTGAARHTTPAGTSEIERRIVDHTDGFGVMTEAFREYGPDLDDATVAAVGHRVVHGGKRFFAPTVITAGVEQDIDELGALAPLHNPPNLEGIRAARRVFPDVPHVAVFDTAFHQTLPPEAYTYAIDAGIAEKHRVRRYGFHGTSHKFVSESAAEFLDRPLAELRTIVLHLGNGASACAVRGGVSIETSMGMTPLEGLVMGTRSGDLDPAVLFHLHRQAGMDIAELDTLLNRRSGLLGLTGTGDMRDVQSAADSGDETAAAALAVYRHRLRSYIGSYIAHLGGVDVIAFTAGVGENNAQLRAETLDGLAHFGILVDADRNAARSRDTRIISTDDSAVTVLVVPTNEELEIARQTLSVS
ncbi:acetate/propionate family kinase [Planctomonas psychrotolerans]|uniref:acetate/propionate family kinase n=1 Tax=Planctomonas psychrotolerans TaxID=2528712 RepID=UPI001238EA93|nr:acetate kinase [Planctomonas psychrotolerans]